MRKFEINFINESNSMYADKADFFETNEEAVKYMLDILGPHCSINFLWCMREEAAKHIEDQNEEFGSDWPIDRDMNLR